MLGFGNDAYTKNHHMEGYGQNLDLQSGDIQKSSGFTSDTTTMTWLEPQERPLPDFSINRKCRDFGALVRWRDENALDDKSVGQVKRPEG
ncbi:hypothetical protein ABVK25_005518 [Lepraria finkii]|uniref:Uncharacterized protein n=1 Tax=Lepraria finkii TaxID=1340010 RepID=A0ABR4BAE2_9LECA